MNKIYLVGITGSCIPDHWHWSNRSNWNRKTGWFQNPNSRYKNIGICSLFRFAFIRSSRTAASGFESRGRVRFVVVVFLRVFRESTIGRSRCQSSFDGFGRESEIFKLEIWRIGVCFGPRVFSVSIFMLLLVSETLVLIVLSIGCSNLWFAMLKYFN